MSSFVFGNNVNREDAENLGPRRVKQVNTGLTTRNAPKRAALGSISNNIRVQPSRAAKTGVENVGQDENAFVKPAKIFGGQENKPFSIFVEEQPARQPLKAVTRSTNVTKPAATLCDITSLVRPPLGPISTATEDGAVCQDVEFDSPMVLDSTIEEIEETRPLDRESIITTVPEYAKEIYSYLREAELKNRPKPGYMKKQQDITNSMRSILVDWMVEVSEEYKLHRETLFLAVNYIDRFLSQMSVQRSKLQLVGAASMFLASKYEEIYPPDVGEFSYITDDTYTKKQVLRMESLVLKVLSFDVAVPTTNWFCDNLLKECDADEKTRALAMFLAELTLVDADIYLKYLPSVIASSAVFLARYALGQEAWPVSLSQSSQYEIGQFASCLTELHQTYCNAHKHPQQALVEKYKTSKFHEVSDFQKHPPPSSLPYMS
ncbi:G2/mitotic-specific cyclin-A-like [Saccostrea echinata]|uniref:G2/mitotic-specific cyclin-A-like n=1 Tax=Saccostrea echinata TaxID=191078 RepID=UPI002A803012|nr:G2/mitotic-specific cyclin-A-like [Saccostrea echinata]